MCDHSDNGPVMIYRGEGGGEKEGESGMEDFWEVTWFLVEKEGGVSVVANRVKRGGGVGCRKLIAN